MNRQRKSSRAGDRPGVALTLVAGVRGADQGELGLEHVHPQQDVEIGAQSAAEASVSCRWCATRTSRHM